MRILLRVAVGVVHPMQNPVAARGQEARALRQVREQVEETLPTLGHRKLTVGAETVQKKRLAKDRQLPVQNEERDQDVHGEYQQASARNAFPESFFRHLPS